MIVKCSECNKPISSIIEYKKKKDSMKKGILSKMWMLNSNICYECLLKIQEDYREWGQILRTSC